jgi:uncharacterized protein (DUF169 family)
MNILHKFATELEKRLRLATHPLAVRMLKTEIEIPKGIPRPKKDWGTCLSTCQAFSLVRRRGLAIAMLKEDMWCPEPVIGFGLATPPQYFLEGHNRYPNHVATLEAGANWVREFPRLEVGQYVGFVAAPLMRANFDPDLVAMYCNSAQLMRLLLSAAYSEGQNVTSQLSGHASCVYTMVPTLKTGKCNVAIPCPGDRNLAGAQDDELIFTVPRASLDDLIHGLSKGGTGTLPTAPAMMAEYKLSPSYAKMARMLGMKKADGSEIQGFVAMERHPYE